MSVASYVPPDYGNMADGSEYAAANDGAHMVVHELAGQFAPHQTEPEPNLQIVVDAGRIEDSQGGVVDVAQQSSAGLAAPTGNPRHDLVYIDADGVIGVEQGAEAGAPVDPTWPAAAAKKLARIVWPVGAAQITNSMIEDLRMPGGGAGGLYENIGFFDLAGLSTVDFFGVPAASYSHLWLEFTEMKFSADTNYVCLRLGTGGTLISTAVYGAGIQTIRHRTSAGGQTQVPDWLGYLAWPPWAYMRSQPANPAHACDLYIRHMDLADTYTLFDGTTNLQYLQGDHYGGVISGSMFYVGAHDRIHAFPYSGSWTQGKATLRGMVKGG